MKKIACKPHQFSKFAAFPNIYHFKLMNQLLSERITQMQESATLKMAKTSRELKAKGLDIIDLSIGEPDFDTPEHLSLIHI